MTDQSDGLNCKSKTFVIINWTCPLTQAQAQNTVNFLCFFPHKAHVFTSASDWVCHPEMFTEATRRQMRPQKSNACMTQATKCFCSSPHHCQCIEWQVQTQPSQPSIPAPAAAAAAASWATFRSWHQMPMRHSYSETPRWDDSEREALCRLSLQQHFPSEWKYLQSNYTKVCSPSSLLHWHNDWHLTC